jgi:hypothetical protein
MLYRLKVLFTFEFVSADIGSMNLLKIRNYLLQDPPLPSPTPMDWHDDSVDNAVYVILFNCRVLGESPDYEAEDSSIRNDAMVSAAAWDSFPEENLYTWRTTVDQSQPHNQHRIRVVSNQFSALLSTWERHSLASALGCMQ